MSVAAERFPAREHSCYVSVLPELRDFSVGDLQSIWADEPEDALSSAVAGGSRASHRTYTARPMPAAVQDHDHCNPVQRPRQYHKAAAVARTRSG